jgi:phospholipase D1/2
MVGILLVLLVSLLAAAWKWTDLAEWADPDRISGMLEPLKTHWYGLPVVVAMFVLAELLVFPVLVLVFVCGIAFGPVLGPVYALAGSVASALPPFFLGRKLGRARVERMGGPLVKRISAALDRRGVVAIFLVRKIPAPFTLVNLVCGASPISLRDFLLGTFLGMGTGVVLLTILGAQLIDLVRDPRPLQLLGAIAVLFAPLVLALAAQRFINRKSGASDAAREVEEDRQKVAARMQPAFVVTSASAVPSPTASPDRILRPGVNCWRIERAEHFRCVQDADQYYRLLRQAILAARRSVFILGWDIYAGLDLAPGGVDDGKPTKLAELLEFVVQRNPQLEVYILIWDYAALYVFERDPLSRIRLGLGTPARVHFRFDDLHPVAGSHHQKVVVIDDRLAFSGGIDLTSHRWDTAAHRVDEPLRTTATGEPFPPYHDVQALVEGPVSAALGELVRRRWTRIGVHGLPLLEPRSDSLWPTSDPLDLQDVDVAIARTEPQFRGEQGVRECEALFYDEIAAARRVIYAEQQYFTNAKLGDALADRLREPNGPEVIVIGPQDCSGWLEKKTMGVLRHRVLAKLLDADLHGRLRLLYPMASRQKGVCTFIHSKCLVIDDDHLRIGSANLSGRSMGMDTECDLIVTSRCDPRLRQEIQRIRDSLVGEHVGRDAEEVAQAIERHGSLRDAIDSFANGDRALVPFVVDRDSEPQAQDALLFAIDPEEPIALSRTIDRLQPALEVDDSRKATRAVFVSVCAAGVLALAAQGVSDFFAFDAASVQDFLRTISKDEGAARWIFVSLIGAGLLFLPFELLVLVPVVLLGALRGSAVAVGAALVCGVVGYLVGRALGPTRIVPFMSPRVRKAWKSLRREGILSVAVVRFVALFSATSIHVMCGAARVHLRDFALGSALGLAPALLASIVLGALLRRLLLDPSPTGSLVIICVALALAAFVLRLRRVVLMRVHGRALREQRIRALHG